MITFSEATAPFAVQFEAFEKEEAGRGPSWLPPLRKAALSRFSELGLPDRHHEEWRFTSINPIAGTDFVRATPENSVLTAEQTKALPFGDLPGLRLVFVNGCYAPELSRLENAPNGVVIGNLAAHLNSDAGLLEPHLGRYAEFHSHPFVALNTAFLAEGAFVSIPRGKVVEETIQILYVSTAREEAVLSHPRALIVAGENSQATVMETFVSYGEGVAFSNAVTEIVVAENALLDHYKVAQQNAGSFHIATMQVQQARGSQFRSHNITLGGAIVRNDHNATLGGEHAECTLNGLYLARERQIVDNHTAIDHAVPNCPSHELYKGILDGQARGVFNGKIFVRKDAQKTDAKQTNQTLLLSREAQIDTKPQLEIFADDVRCTHGATIGQLNAESLFYLRARGIGEQEARSLLVYAFAGDVIERIQVEALRNEIETELFDLLPGGNIVREAIQ